MRKILKNIGMLIIAFLVALLIYNKFLYESNYFTNRFKNRDLNYEKAHSVFNNNVFNYCKDDGYGVRYMGGNDDNITGYTLRIVVARLFDEPYQDVLSFLLARRSIDLSDFMNYRPKVKDVIKFKCKKTDYENLLNGQNYSGNFKYGLLNSFLIKELVDEEYMDEISIDDFDFNSDIEGIKNYGYHYLFNNSNKYYNEMLGKFILYSSNRYYNGRRYAPYHITLLKDGSIIMAFSIDDYNTAYPSEIVDRIFFKNGELFIMEYDRNNDGDFAIPGIQGP